MKFCPQCRSSYSDDTLRFCLQDGTPLAEYVNRSSQMPTEDFVVDEQLQSERPAKSSKKFLIFAVVAGLFLALGIGGTFVAVKLRGAGGEANSNVNRQNARPNVNRANNVNAVKNVNASATPSPTPTPALTPTATPDQAAFTKLVDDEIEKQLKDEDLVKGDKSSRQTLFGDLDGDGDKDAAVSYGFEYKEGNNYGFALMVFVRDDGDFKFAADEVIGGKLNRSAEMKSIADGKINFDTLEYAPNDGSCCPSIKGKTAYVLQKNKLIEVKK